MYALACCIICKWLSGYVRVRVYFDNKVSEEKAETRQLWHTNLPIYNIILPFLLLPYNSSPLCLCLSSWLLIMCVRDTGVSDLLSNTHVVIWSDCVAVQLCTLAGAGKSAIKRMLFGFFSPVSVSSQLLLHFIYCRNDTKFVASTELLLLLGLLLPLDRRYWLLQCCYSPCSSTLKIVISVLNFLRLLACARFFLFSLSTDLFCFVLKVLISFSHRL